MSISQTVVIGGAEDDSVTTAQLITETDVDNSAELEDGEIFLGNTGVYTLSSALTSQTEYTEWVNSILEHTFIENNGEGGLNNARRDPMDEDAVQLVLLNSEIENFLPFVILTAALFFAAGFCGGIINFKRKL